MTADDVAVTEAFSRLQRGVEAAVAPPATRIESLGRRRRTGRVALAGLTVLAVLAGGWSIMRDPDRQTMPVPAVTPSIPAVSPSVPTTPTPTGTRLERVPPGFLAGESQGDGAIDNHDYSEDCLGRPVARRSASLPFGTGAQQVRLVESLYVYRDEDAARTVMRDLPPRMQRCSGFEGAQVLRPVETQPLGSEAWSLTVALPRDGAAEHTGEPYRFLAVRVGTAIGTFEGLGSSLWEASTAQELVGRMCPYKATCAPPTRTVDAVRPAPGGEAWAVVAGVEGEPVTERSGALGKLGYRPAVVPLACDAGAAAALGGSAATTYTVVYFGSEQHARTVADPLGLKVVRVRTYCV